MSRKDRSVEPKAPATVAAAAPTSPELLHDGAPKPQGGGTKKRNPDYDPLIADSIFPDAEAVFTTQPIRLQQVKDKACVVLDTNALLLPYEVSPLSLQNVESAYTKLIADGRLFIPAQVAREFARNRAKKLGEVHESLSNRRSQFQPKQVRPETKAYSLLEAFPEYQRVVAIENRFGEIDREVQDLTKEYRDKLGKAMRRISDWEWDDPVSQIYSRLFKPELIRHPSLKPEDILAEHARRTTHQIPPGYQDSTKDDGGVGDMLIWLTMLDIGKTRGSSVIFVTGERKADWWHKSGGEPIYPRYELQDEFRRYTGHSFHMLNLSDILEQFGAATSVLAEVRDKEASINLRLPALQGHESYYYIEGRVKIWLEETCRRVEHVQPGMGCDFYVIPKNGENFVGVEIKAYRQRVNLRHIIKEFVVELQKKDLSSNYIPNDYWLIMVYPSQEDALRSQETLVKQSMDFSFARLTLILGYLAEDGSFVPTVMDRPH
jgi:rRNA-processing protein FCF1